MWLAFHSIITSILPPETPGMLLKDLHIHMPEDLIKLCFFLTCMIIYYPLEKNFLIMLSSYSMLEFLFRETVPYFLKNIIVGRDLTSIVSWKVVRRRIRNQNSWTILGWVMTLLTWKIPREASNGIVRNKCHQYSKIRSIMKYYHKATWYLSLTIVYVNSPEGILP